MQSAPASVSARTSEGASANSPDADDKTPEGEYPTPERAYAPEGVLIAWTVIAFHLAKLLVESAIAIGGLPIMLAFAGHSVTFGMAEGFFRYVIHLGVRIYVTYLLVGVGRHLAVEWAQDIQLGFPLEIMTDSVTLAAGAALFALLVVALPRTIAQHVAGGVSFAGLNPMGHRDA